MFGDLGASADDHLPFNIWCRYYLQWQGCHAQEGEPINSDVPAKLLLGKENILYQDNTSSIKLETNGKCSSTKRMRHIIIRYFMVTDRVKKGELRVEYCPTGEMLADIFTKPLQRSLFKKFRNKILEITKTKCIAYKAEFKNV